MNSKLSVLLLLVFPLTNLLAQSIAIPTMTWTPRSDWLNVVTTYGADPTGAADSTTAIQNAISAVNAGTSYANKSVYFPSGTYKISTTLQMGNWVGGTFVGSGKNTILKWYGASGQPMLTTNSPSQTRFVGLVWNGNNLASCGVQSMNTQYEFHNRHENEEFLNFTVSGTDQRGNPVPSGGIVAGINPNENAPTAESMVWNCLFYNCTNGIIAGYEVYNDDMWQIQNCEFENCGTGVNTIFGECIITNCHFQNSTSSDILGGHGEERIHHCTSSTSAAFYIEGQTPEGQNQVIQDCWVDKWTNTAGAIQFNNSGPSSVFDCTMTHAPAGCLAPISENGPSGSVNNLMISNNAYSATFTSPVHSYNSYLKLVTVPSGNNAGQLTSPSQRFLTSTAIVDVASSKIIDLSKPPYSVDLSGGTDATTAVQNAISAAQVANNGSVVYFPNGFYRLSSGLTAGGSNYSLQGDGPGSRLVDLAPSGTPMLTLTNPTNVTLQQINFNVSSSTTPAVNVTSSGAGSLYLDGAQTQLLYSGNWFNGQPDQGPGIQLISLPAGFVVRGLDVPANLTANDSGPALILTRFLINNGVLIEGATQPKTGFLGADILEGMQYVSNSAYNVTITDNQDFVIGDRYSEQGEGGDFQLLRGNATWTGHFASMGFNSELGGNGQSHTPAPTININNYAGDVMYSSGSAGDTGGTIELNQTGSNPVNFVYMNTVDGGGVPTVSVSSAANFVMANTLSTDYPPVQYADSPNPLTTSSLATISRQYDFYRLLGMRNFFYNYNIAQVILNPYAETDTVNPNPTMTPGYVPANWTPANTLTTATGVRNFTTQSGGSPFGTGSKSMLWEDTTGSSSGSALTVACTAPATNVNLSAVENFDFKVGNSPSVGCDFWIGSVCGYDYGAALHIQAGGTTVNILANVSGTETLLTSLSVNTWYRVQVKMLAPSAGPSNATVYITPWNLTKKVPGTTLTYTINGTYYQEPSGFSGFSIYSQTAPGNYQSVSFDNMSIITNGTLTLPSP